ncbi:hypothetical protein ABIF97_004144 [Bradyrhizobium japonicum]
MIKRFRNATAVLTFAAVSGASSFGFINSYFVFGLALIASFIIGSCTERVLVDRAYREMVRLYGAEWGYEDNEQPSPLTKLRIATLVIVFIAGLFAFDARNLP